MMFEWKALKGQLFEQSKTVKSSNEVLEGLQMLLKTAPDSMEAILELVKLILTISVSTAEVERGFSSLNMIKTSQRSIMLKELGYMMPLTRMPWIHDQMHVDADLQIRL